MTPNKSLFKSQVFPFCWEFFSKGSSLSLVFLFYLLLNLSYFVFLMTFFPSMMQ